MTTEAKAMREAAAQSIRDAAAKTVSYIEVQFLELAARRIEALPLPPPQPNPAVEAMAAALDEAFAAVSHSYQEAHAEWHDNNSAMKRHSDFVNEWRRKARAALADFRKGEA
jgi:hypothetical protein